MDIEPAAAHHRAHHVVALVHAVAAAIDKFVRRGLGRPGKRVALHVLGDFDPCQRQHGGPEVDEVHRVLDPRARRGGRQVAPLRRIIDDERHMGAAFLQEALAARQHPAVVSVVKHDGVLRQSRVGQFLELGGELAVEVGDAGVVAGPVGAHLGRVRLIGRNPHRGRIKQRGPALRKQTTLVADLVVEHAEKRLAGAAVLIGGLFAAGIPRLLDVDRRIVIGLGVVGCVIARGAQIRRKPFEPGRQLALRPHVLGRAAADGIQPADQGEARRRAHRHGETSLIQHALARQLVDGRRLGQRIAVTAQQAIIVLADEPEDVRFGRCRQRGGRRRSGGEKNRQQGRAGTGKAQESHRRVWCGEWLRNVNPPHFSEHCC